MSKLILKITAFFTGRKVVMLKHFDEEISYSLAKTSDWDSSVQSCYVHTFTRVGYVVLNADGTTGGYGTSYIKEWKYL